MSLALVITLRLHDGRYHGAGEWPPSPARLLQALVAGAGLSGPLGQEESDALEWLEKCSPPLIAAPRMWDGQTVMLYMPNNDLDAVGGDPRRIAEVRGATKLVKPRMFDATIPFSYAWSVDAGEDGARIPLVICSLADRLYQFGRGVDMAWSWGEVLADEDLDARLASYPGRIYRPSGGGSGQTLACPKPGSLASLKERYAANSQRFKTEGQGKTARQLFSQPPKPRFAQVAYDNPPSRLVFDLRQTTAEAPFAAWPLRRASQLVGWLRDAAVERLRRTQPDRGSEIDRFIVGRKADGSDAAPIGLRVRIVPLPSIGHLHADHRIRRVLVEVPAGCPLRADDVKWAFSNLDLIDPETGEMLGIVLTPSDDMSMLVHYGVIDRAGGRVWRTATAAVLPESAKRRRIDPARLSAEGKGGAERAAEQMRAAAAVSQALRHAEIWSRAESIRVQREPFEAKGDRAESFAQGTRFAKERLWHVEVNFNEPITGPLVFGDGRFLGLGVMAPVRKTQEIHTFVVDSGFARLQRPEEIANALRRAVMTRVQDVLGPRKSLPAFFTGHDVTGSPAKSEIRPHLTFVFEPSLLRLLVIAPHVVDRRNPWGDEIRYLETLDEALVGFRELRAGASGRLTLRASPIDANADPLFAPSRFWESVTPYQVTRHAKRVTAVEALSGDIRLECSRRGLPNPLAISAEPHGVPGVGLVGMARLTFQVSVQGPIVLGKSRHLGGGLFKGIASERRA